MKTSNSLTTFLTIIGAIALSLILIPLVFKGVILTSAAIGSALILAATFILGILLAVAVLSPLWIPFLAGWAAVRFCQKYYNKEEVPPTPAAPPVLEKKEVI